MNIQDAEFDIDLLPDSVAVSNMDDFKPKDVYQIRRMIERRAEVRRLRDMLGEPDFNDLD